MHAPDAAHAAKPAPPAKRVWCIRHGRALHNELMDQGRQKEGRELRDPPLSDTGIQQARNLVEESPIFRTALCSQPRDRAQLVVSSPCWRALQTAREACAAARAAGAQPPRILAHPGLQECGEYPCDTGQPLSVLAKEFPDVDFSLLSQKPDDWFQKPGVKNGGMPQLFKRCDDLTSWLCGRPEERVVVVAHSTLFAHLLQVDFANCEVIEMRLLLDIGMRSTKVLGPLLSPCPFACESPHPQSALPLHPAVVEGHELWRRRWELALAADRVVPFFSSKGSPITMHGSPPLRGTLKTCYETRGERSAKATARRAGIEFPLWMTMGV